jgi:hypothetical protein
VDEKVKSLDEKVKSLERTVFKVRAEAAGLKNPEIVNVNLQENVKFESRTRTPLGEYHIIYTIVQYNPASKVLRLRLDGKWQEVVYRNNIINMTNFSPGVVTPIPKLVPDLPQVFVQVLELPSPKQAILAIGPKTGKP